MKCDVIVIGAGPGGSMAAKSAAEAGLDVLILEKRQEIGEPIRCAEGVAIRSELRELIDIEPSWISNEVKGVRLYSPDGSSVFTTEENGGEEGGYILERKTFDRGLALRAEECGAKLMIKTRATGLARTGERFMVSASGAGEPLEIKAPLVIGADGIESKVARWAGLNSKLSPEDIMICAQFQVCGRGFDRDYCEFFFGRDLAPGGYAWIFPKRESLANVGIGLAGSRSESGLPLRLLKRFLEKKMPDAKIIQMMAGGIPTSGQMKSIVSDGLMLTGDAAHQSDPLTGGGIINAMRAGIIAGEVAAKAVSSGDVSRQGLKEYEERCSSSFGIQIAKSLNAKKFFLSLSDDDLNHLAASLQGQDISRMNTENLLKFLFKQNPKMLWKMRSLLL